MKFFVVALAIIAAVSAQVSKEYLPPVENAPSSEYLPPVESAPLADDGYRYKTIRKLKYRHRRDVSELNNEYLPPVEAVAEAAPIAPEPVQDSAVLADDGYQTRLKLKYRHRRDVSELPSSEYLPPTAEYLPPVEEAAPLADDGYRYKTVRRLKYR
uniref:DUF4794 domain-containing protein n=1 Tax=Megaselia scalaris TaxID=36166 RepID=T1GQL8_MEGSC